jgi:hypothetical protein
MFECRKERERIKEANPKPPLSARPIFFFPLLTPAWATAAQLPFSPQPAPLFSLFPLDRSASPAQPEPASSSPEQPPTAALPSFLPLPDRSHRSGVSSPLAISSVLAPAGPSSWPLAVGRAAALSGPSSPLCHAQPGYALAGSPRPESSRRGAAFGSGRPQRPARSGGSVDPHAKAANFPLLSRSCSPHHPPSPLRTSRPSPLALPVPPLGFR